MRLRPRFSNPGRWTSDVLLLSRGSLALLLALTACSPDKVIRGTGQASFAGAVGSGGATGLGSGGHGAGSGGVGGAAGSNASSGSGGFTYVPPNSGGAGGTTTTVTWTTPPVNKDAGATAEVCKPATPPGTGPGHQVIMVVKSIASPGTTPTLLKTHLEARGFKVDYAFIYTSSTKTDAGSIPNLWFFDDAKTKVVDFSQYGLAVVTKDGYKSGANLDNIPVLCGNNQTSDSALAMATTDGNTSSTKGAFTLIDPKHPIAAMQTGDSLGTVLLETGSSPVLKVMLAVVPATAHVVGVDWGTAAPGTSAAALFAYDVGDALVAGTAKARRVGFFLDDSTSWSAVVAGSMTWQFFDAAVDWLVGLTPCSGPTP
jgi:hypothetical protein